MRYKTNPVLFSLFFLAWILAACSADWAVQLIPTQAPAVSNSPTEVQPTPTMAAEITFQVELPPDTPPEEPVFINILEEVNGLAISAQPYQMDAIDAQLYSITVPFALGSVVKYRYSRQGEAAPVEEHLSDGRQVRYRLYHVTGPGVVEDVVSRWTDSEFSGPTGRISGQALDSESGLPIPGLLAAAGGGQALTASDGSFLIEGLPPGIHNLVLYALDGSYRTFQQGARIEADATTPARVSLSEAPLVNLVFVVTMPPGTIPVVPVRMAGNLYQLGNTFANLVGGVSTLAVRMPVLTALPDGRYSLAIALPAGADVHYLYTFGDGIWNTEKTSGNPYPVRQLIVPEENTQVNDLVESWSTQGSAAVTFDITVPATTPPNDTVSIQFKPLFGWTEPLPMWRLGPDRWAYVLNSPPTNIGDIEYRVCRNGQCGSADDANTMGPNADGYPVTPGELPQTIIDKIDSWSWLDPNQDETTVTAPPIAIRGTSFWAGVELQPAFHPSWTTLTPGFLDDIQNLGANWLVFTPTWTFTRATPTVLEPVAGQDPLWQDMSLQMEAAQARGLSLALFPMPRFGIDPDAWWADAPRDFPWWQTWFERYRSFILHHADLANQKDAQALILGGDWLTPALPGGTLEDGSPSGVPVDAEERWRTLIEEVRARYDGRLLWALSYDQAASNPPPFLDSVDQIYLQFSAKLSDRPDPLIEEMQAEASRLLDNVIQPLQATLGKPLILAAAYSSANGAGQACFPIQDGSCLELSALSRPNEDIPGIPLDLQEQADIYSALFEAVNQRTWISGFTTQGFYPPASLQDKSTSVHGKQAGEVIRYWFPQLLGLDSPE